MFFKAAATLLLGICASPIFCQTVVNPGPVEAELLKPLNIRRLTAGSTVFARVTRDWNGPDCSLRQGSTLTAKVEVSEPHKVRGDSRLALSFTHAQCNGIELKPMELLLSAVAAPPANWDNVVDAAFKTPVEIMNPGLTQLGTERHASGDTRFGNDLVGGIPMAHLEFKGVNHHFPMSANVQAGDVIDLKGMKLDLATGPNRSSVLSSKGQDVALDAYTQFLLVPFSMLNFQTLRAAADPGEMSEIAQKDRVQADLKVVNDLEVCAPPGCAVDLPVTPEELKGKIGGSIAVRPLGYVSRPTMNLGDFTEDEALAWVGPRHLIFTFNAHRLIRREGVANAKAARRVIRAVLIDVQTRSVIRAIDWEVTDLRRYLWPLAEGRVLAHVGNELRVYGPGLEVEKRVPLAGPLAFVRIAPNGKVLAVAMLQERHSPELHSKLQNELVEEPEEDVAVTILDKAFNAVARTATVSNLEPPTLLNEGQVVLFAQPNSHYRIALNAWDGKSTTLARFGSLCTPELSSVAPDLLFLLTCSMDSNRAEYRVLNAAGKLLMRGEAGPREVGQEVGGDEASGLFAVKAVRASRDLARGMDFTGADLDSEDIRVYRADGKRLSAFRVDEPTTSRGGFSLSPDGAQIAVISNSQIQFFPLTAH
jgi:hypothetical protein